MGTEVPFDNCAHEIGMTISCTNTSLALIGVNENQRCNPCSDLPAGVEKSSARGIFKAKVDDLDVLDAHACSAPSLDKWGKAEYVNGGSSACEFRADDVFLSLTRSRRVEEHGQASLGYYAHSIVVAYDPVTRRDHHAADCDGHTLRADAPLPRAEGGHATRRDRGWRLQLCEVAYAIVDDYTREASLRCRRRDQIADYTEPAFTAARDTENRADAGIRHRGLDAEVVARGESDGRRRTRECRPDQQSNSAHETAPA
jgi:hypothetical protein